MINQQLFDFTKQQLQLGVAKEKISSDLLANGWNSQDIDEVFNQIDLSIRKNRQTIINNNSVDIKHKKVGSLILLIIILFIIAGGASAYYYKNNLSQLPVIGSFFTKTGTVATLPIVDTTITSNTSTPQTTDSATKAVINTLSTETNANCDNNYQCLVLAASKCQPISGIISYTLPNPIIKGIDQSGQNNYEIKPSQGSINNCTLIVTSLSSHYSISDANRKKFLNSGITSSQIDEQLKSMNDSSSIISKSPPSVCHSNTDTITSYLTNLKNGIFVNEMVDASSNLDSSTTHVTYTTTTGKKLVCTQTLSSIQTPETDYLYLGSTMSGDNRALSFKVTNLTSNNLTMIVTDTSTNQSQSVSLNINDSISIFKHSLKLIKIQQVNTGTSNGKELLETQASLEVSRL